MADTVLFLQGPNGLNVPIKAVDNGDGTYSLSVDGAGGGGGGGPDRELLISYFRAKNAFTGASVGDLIRSTTVLDVSGTGPTQVGDTLWFNETTQLALANAPATADLEPALGTAGVTNAQLVAALTTQTNALLAATYSVTATGNVAHGAADAGNPVKVGAVYKNAPAALTAGTRVDLQTTNYGWLGVALYSPTTQSALGTTTNQADNVIGSNVPVIQASSFNYLWNPVNSRWFRPSGTPDGQYMQGSVASGATAAGNPVPIGANYVSGNGTSVSTGQRVSLRANTFGALLTNTWLAGDTAGDGLANTSAKLNFPPDGGSGHLPMSGMVGFNGTSWDRVRTTVNGLYVQGPVAPGATAAGNPVYVGGIYRGTLASVTNGQMAPMMMSQWGTVMTSILPSSTQASDSLSNVVVTMPMAYNGSGVTIPPAAGFMYDSIDGWSRVRGHYADGLTVNTIKGATAGKTLAVTGTSANIQLTTGTRRVELYARGADMRYSMGGTNTITATNVAPSLFIAQGERIVTTANAWIAAIADSLSGSQTGQLEITELA